MFFFAFFVLSQVGDPLEKHFLHPLAEETVHRVVRTAFFAACPEGGDTRESGCSSMIQDRILESGAGPQRIDRYEWVQRFRDVRAQNRSSLCVRIDERA